MESFKILPILGTKRDVPPDDGSMFQFVGEGVALTHDAGGQNVSYVRKNNTCTKALGKEQWSNSANAQATRCVGLFELISGANVDYLYFDNGKVYYYDSANDPVNIDAAVPVTFGQTDDALVSAVQFGEYVVFTDAGKSQVPHMWANGLTNLATLIAAGNDGDGYKFKYIENFQRRVVGAYSGETNGDIDIRWTTSWPETAIGVAGSTGFSFPLANQLYVPNGDSITGIKVMGGDSCFIYCKSSIHALDYLPDFTVPFRVRSVITDQGCVSHHSIVNVANNHYFYNVSYGFCIFNGSEIQSISQDIEFDLKTMNTAYLDQIYGIYIPFDREIVWTVPYAANSTPDTLLFYNIDTKQWRKEVKEIRVLDTWTPFTNFTWAAWIAYLGGAGALWSDAGTAHWADYTAQIQQLVMGNTDGQLYIHASETDTTDIDGYRIEPVLSFGDAARQDIILEIWFGIGNTGAYSIDVYHRSGNTVGELLASGWSSIGSVSCNSVSRPVIHCNKIGRVHQIKWGTNLNSEKFEVNSIVIKYQRQSTV